jgi:hypothetical protein
VKEIGLSTSIVWSGIGNDNKINANEIVAPFYTISNTFICITIKVGCLSVINSSRNGGVDINFNCSGLQAKCWVCVIYDNTQSIFVNGLEVGATWQYSISGDNGFIDGTGNSFTLANNATYAVNA